MQEGDAEKEEQGEGRHEDPPGMIHDTIGKSFPATGCVRRSGHRGGRGCGPGRRWRRSSKRQALQVRSDQRQAGRQERHRGQGRHADDDGAGDADRTQDHELEQKQARQAEQDGQAAEEDRSAGGRDRRHDGRLDGLAIDRAVRAPAAAQAKQLFAEAAGHEQRVVDPQAEPEQRRQVEDEDAHRRHRRQAEDGGQGDDDRRSADDERHAGRHDRAEDEQERERRDRQRDQLGTLEVALGDGLDVAVEDGAAGQERSHARGLSERGSDRFERLG